MRRAPARVRPVAAATSVSVCSGRVASNARITASPRAKDCTYESPGLSGAASALTGTADGGGRALLMGLKDAFGGGARRPRRCTRRAAAQRRDDSLSLLIRQLNA